MLKVQNRYTRRVRVAQIVFFLMLILLTSLPFAMAVIEKGGKTSLKSFTALDFISYIGTDSRLSMLGGLCIPFIVIPVIALGFQIFDRERNLKNIVGIICSVLGIFWLVQFVTFVGPDMMSIGSVLSIILYLLTAFLSIMGIFTRLMDVPDKPKKQHNPDDIV